MSDGTDCKRHYETVLFRTTHFYFILVVFRYLFVLCFSSSLQYPVVL